MNTFQFPPQHIAPVKGASVIPDTILDAAFLLSAWMAEHNKEYWQLGGVCDRRFAYREAATAEYSKRDCGELE